MKVCLACNTKKPLDEYYLHKQMLDGYLNKCKECVKSRVHTYRINNLAAVTAYDKKRDSLPHRIKIKQKYLKTDSGKKAKAKASLNYKKRYPMKYAAHIITANAIRSGKLLPVKNCSECNSTNKIEGHHDDYTKPLNIKWLCELCHKEWHRHNKPIYE
jgi:hypothetical protein